MRKIEAQGKVARRDEYRMSPSDIVADEKRRGRKFPPSEETVKELAESMLEYNQLEPCVGRMLPDNRVGLVAGFTRHAAAQWIVDNVNDEFLLRVTILPLNEDEGFRANIVENHYRQETSAIDDAFNIRILGEQMGWSDKEIAALYHRTPAWVSGRRKLIELPTKTQKLVHEGRLPASSAIGIIAMPEEEQEAAIKEATTASGKVNGQKLQRNTRGQTGKRTGLSVKEVRDFFSEEFAPEDPDPIKRFVKEMLKFLSGEMTSQQMQNAVKRLYEAE